MIRTFGAALLGFAMACGNVRHAQDYPTQTIKLIVPFLAGGPVDALARVVAQHLQNRLGQNVIVENRSAAAPPSAPRRSRRRRPTATRCSSSARTSPTTRCCFPISISIRPRR